MMGTLPSIHTATHIHTYTHNLTPTGGLGLAQPRVAHDLLEREAAAGVDVEHAAEQVHGRVAGAGHIKVLAVVLDEQLQPAGTCGGRGGAAEEDEGRAAARDDRATSDSGRKTAVLQA